MSCKEHTVVVQSRAWQKYGGRMMRWIDSHISEDCYRFRFGNFGEPMHIIFEERSQAVLFNLSVLHGDLEDLGTKS